LSLKIWPRPKRSATRLTTPSQTLATGDLTPTQEYDSPLYITPYTYHFANNAGLAFSFQKLADSESKYKQYSSELVDQINRVREKKETLFPEYIKRLADAQVSFYRSALAAAERLQSSLDSSTNNPPSP